MNLSNTQRVIKLLGNLASNVGLIGPYLKHNVLTKKYPVEWDLPWWSYKAIAAMDKIAPGKSIFEYGTGGSTTRYGKVSSAHVAVEDDVKWLGLLKNYCSQELLGKINFIEAPFNFKNPKDFESSKYLNALKQSHDIVIIDGQDHTFNERITCFHHAEKFARPGNLIVVDDFWRYEHLLDSNHARSVVVHESVGPCRYGVTSTAFFSY